MTDIMRVKREPSEELLSLINELVDTGAKFTNIIDKVWQQGEKEGFTKEEIADIVRPIARQRGLNKDQVYYLTHKPERQENSKRQYEELKQQQLKESRNITTIEDKPIKELELFFEHKEKGWLLFKRAKDRDSAILQVSYMFMYKDSKPYVMNSFDEPADEILKECKKMGYKLNVQFQDNPYYILLKSKIEFWNKLCRFMDGEIGLEEMCKVSV
jgi:hypothetical protein